MPVYEVTDPKTGMTLELDGDSPPTELELEELFSKYSVQKQTTAPEAIVGAGEAIASLGTGMIAEPLSGLYGAGASLFGGDGGKAVEDARSAMTYQPRTDAGQQYMQNIANAPVIKQVGEVMQSVEKGAGDLAYNLTGSPAIAAGASAIPAAIGQAIGFAAPARAASRLERGAANLAEEAKVMSAPSSQAQSTATTIARGNAKSIADIADADPAFFDAMNKLGVTAEPLPSYASRNPEYRGVEQGLSAIPGSPLAPTEISFLKNVSDKADEIISQYGGSLDKPEMSNRFRSEMDGVVNKLSDEADAAYNLIGERLDKRAAANPEKTLKFINDEVENLALKIDDPDVPSTIKQALKSLSPRKVSTEAGEQVIPPTYANVDGLRKQIGAALYKKEGTFKDAESGTLKRLYANLTEDLDAMAEAQGLSAEVKAAKAVVAKRKSIEDKYQSLLGNQLQKDAVPVVGAALKGLQRGKVEDFRKTINNIPDPELRQQVLLTSLNDVFRGTAMGKDRFDATQYTKWHADTLRNPSIRKELSKHLPKDSIEKMDALNLIANGISTALKDKKPTGVVNAMFDEKSGILRNLAGKAAGTAANAATKGLAGGVVSDLINASTNQARTASNLLSDPALIQAIREGVEAGTVTGRAKSAKLEAASKKLEKSAKYKKWADTLSDSDKAKLASVGAVNFIISASDEENK